MSINVTAEIIKNRLKQELKTPDISDLRCAYLIQKIKLLNMHRRNSVKKNKLLS